MLLDAGHEVTVLDSLERGHREERAAHSATDRAIETLVGELSLSVRDAGDVLGLSHQRVHQLVGARRR